MQKIMMLLMALIMAGCGLNDPDVRNTRQRFFAESDPFFDSYKDSFEADHSYYAGYEINTESVYINFAEDSFFDTLEIGTCYFVSGTQSGREILIRESYWNSMSNSCREFLVYHELAHCALDQTHRSEYPSVMNENIGYCSYYYSYRESFVSEMFLQDEDSINILESL